MNNIKEKLKKLVENGYGEDLTPTLAENNKKAFLEDWTNRKTTTEDIANWKQGQGIGLVCRRCVAADIDMQHSAEDAEAIQQIAVKILGAAPCRIGKDPKRLLLYGSNGAPITKRTLKFWRDGIEERIEILGEKQQCVIYGTHPETGKPYTWHDGEPCTIPIDNLTTVSEDQINNFIEQAETYLLESGYALSLSEKPDASSKSERKPIGHHSLMADDMDVLASALLTIPNDLSYDDWIRLIAAYKAGVGGNQVYYPVVEEWSLQWPDNTPVIVRQKWDSITHAEAGAGTIFYEAKKRGWKFPNLFSRKSPYNTADTILENCFSCDDKRTLVYTQDFYLWKDGFYQAISEDQIKKVISEQLEKATQWDQDEKEKVPFNPKKNDIAEVLEAIKNKTLVSLEYQKTPPFWIGNDRGLRPLEILCVKNGLLHIPSRTIIPHTPDFFTVNSLPYEYNPDAPPPKEWLKFLYSVWTDDPESIECLQMWMGYLLTPDTSQHKILMFTGPARSGKGTISRTTTLLLGKKNVVSPLIGSFKDFGVEPLIDKIAALINDARPPKSGEIVRNIIETLLTISGEDYVSVRRKFKGNWDGYLPVRFVLFSNEIPSTLKDPSQALAKRFIHLKMTKSFYDKEDRYLSDKLEAEISSILNWALEGYEKLQQRGKFIQPESGKDALDYLKENSNPLASFISDCCVIAPEREILTEDLREAYSSYCGDNEMTAQDFGTNLRALYPVLNKVKKAQGYVYVGIGLNGKPVSEFFWPNDKIDLDSMMQ